MFTPRVGMKIYDNVWYIKYRLEPQQAADILAGMGVTYVMAQGRLLPMQDTAISSEVSSRDAARLATLDDRKFRDALAQRGIAYFASLNIGFDPSFIAANTELLPIDQFGKREEKTDWYIGLPPDREANIAHKAGMLEAAVRALEPDGVHLGFIRWPGFWEIWLPDVLRSEMPDYCYSAETLARFNAETGNTIPTGDPIAAARLLAQRYRAQWRDWKCAMTNRAVGTIRKRVTAIRPGIKIAINTLPFFRDDFENVGEEVFGQSPSRLPDVADVFEVMTYHQILARDASWPAAIGADIKRRCQSTTVCTIQGSALYLDGMHANRGRKLTITTDEFIDIVDKIEATDVDGLCVFTFTDFLEMRGNADGQRRIDRLKNFRK